MKIKLLIIIIILALLYFQYQTINNINYSLDILQVNNPDKEKFEETINKKCISIFTGVTKDLLDLDKLDFKDLKNMNDENKIKLRDTLKNHYNYYLIPLCIHYDFTINMENDKFTHELILQKNYRFLMSQITGTKKIFIFNPNQKQYLYFDKNNKSKVDFFNQDLKSFPLISKSRYIELILSPGQMIYIPHGWIYCYQNIDDNFFINCVSESCFSYFLKK